MASALDRGHAEPRRRRSARRACRRLPTSATVQLSLDTLEWTQLAQTNFNFVDSGTPQGVQIRPQDKIAPWQSWAKKCTCGAELSGFGLHE